MLQTLGKYKIETVLGQGAMGVVYRAYDPVIKRQVALKTMSGDFQANPEMLQRFYREAQSAGSLRHFNVVTIYDLGEENHQPYIAMEYLEGANLQDLIRQKSVTTLNRVLHIMRQCCEGLHYAHCRDIVHRDVKPANIFILHDDTVKIVDFGIAMVGASTITKTGMVMGTVSYMSPEQVQGQPLDGRSDQFSLGIILYELLTGKKPFQGENIPAICMKIVSQAPAPVRDLYPHCPPPLESVLQRCLAKNRDHRYPSLNEMARDLEKISINLKQVYSLQEPVTLESGHTATLWQDSLDEVRALIEEGKIGEAGLRLDDIQRRWGSRDEMLAQRVEALRGQISYQRNQTQVRHKLDSIVAMAREGLFEQAEHLLDDLEHHYPEVEAIFQTRRTVLEEKQIRTKIADIRSRISQARFFLETDNTDKALVTIEEALKLYPEEKSLIGFYKRIHEQKTSQGKREFIRTTCTEVSRLLAEGKAADALRTLENAIRVYPGEEIFQNLYRNLLSEKRKK